MKTRSNLFCRIAAGLLLWVPSQLAAQTAGAHVVSVEPPQGLAARRGTEAQVALKLVVRSGYHINSSTPAEDYLIPTVLNWDSAPLAVRGITYPKAESVQYEFSAKPLLVYSGAVTVSSRFAVPQGAAPGAITLKGKLRYQACTDKMCLAPRTLDISVPIKIE